MTRIFDGFIVYDEIHLVRCRMRELADRDDVTHVCVEAHHTHQGADKTLRIAYRLQDSDRGGIDVDRFVLVAVPLPHPGGDRGGVGSPLYQVRERAQRQAILGAAVAAGAQPDDLLLVSDVDEICDSDTIDELARLASAPDARDYPDPARWAVASQTMYGMALDWRMEQPWLGTTASLIRYADPNRMRDARGPLRESDRANWVEGGWHLSWLGSPAEKVRKQQAFSHAELNHRTLNDFRAHIEDGRHSNDEQMVRVTQRAAENYPLWILEGNAPAKWWADEAAGIGTKL